MVSHNEALLSTPASQVPNPYVQDKNILETPFLPRCEPRYVESYWRDDRQRQQQRNFEMNSSQSGRDDDVKLEGYMSPPIKAESPTSVAEAHSSNHAGSDQPEATDSTYDQALNHTLWDHPLLRDHASNQTNHASAAQESSVAQGHQEHHFDHHYDSQHRQGQLYEGQHHPDQHFLKQEDADQYPQNQEYMARQYPEYHRDYDHSYGHHHTSSGYHRYGQQQYGQQQYGQQQYGQQQHEHQGYQYPQYDHQSTGHAYSPYSEVLHGQATAYSQVHAGVTSQDIASPRTRGFASVPMSSMPEFSFVDSSIRPAAVGLLEPQASYVSPYGHVSPRGNYHPRCPTHAHDRESPGTTAPGPASENLSPVVPQISPPIPVPDVQPQESSAKESPHKSWRPAPKNTTKCDICNSRAWAQTVHQRCTRCTVVICRTCVEKGFITRLRNHSTMDVYDFDWGKMRPSRRMVKESKASAGATDQTDQPTSTSLFASKTTPNSARRQSKLEHRGLLPSSTTARNTAPSTPAERAIPASTHYVDISDEDGNDEKEDTGISKNSPSFYGAYSDEEDYEEDYEEQENMDLSMKSPSSEGASSDRDYKPASNEGFFSESRHSQIRERPSEVARGSSETNTTPGFSNSLGSVGLANSRPVRTSSLVTYEKMRAQPYQRYAEQPALDTRDDAMNPPRRREKARKEKRTGPRISFVNANHLMSQLDPHSRILANDTSLFRKPDLSPSTQQSIFGNNQNAKPEFDKKMSVFQMHASNIYAKALARNPNLAHGGFSKEMDLLVEVTEFWFSHKSAQAFRLVDEVAAFALLRVHVDIATRRFNMTFHWKLDQWLNTTENQVQDGSGRSQINTFEYPQKDVLHAGLDYYVTPEDIMAANALLSLRFS